MLIRQSIPSLFNGVSQQAASLRLLTQGELQENAYPSIADGLRKRPPTKHIAKNALVLTEDVQTHVIYRDENEQYIVVLLDGDLKVFDLKTGASKTVNIAPSVENYLDCKKEVTGDEIRSDPKIDTDVWTDIGTPVSSGRISATYHSYTNSWKWESAGTGVGVKSPLTTSFTSGKQYRLEMWVWGTKISAYDIKANDGSTNFIEDTSVYLDATSKWVKVTLYGTATNTTSNGYVQIVLNNATGGTVYIDDVSIKEVEDVDVQGNFAVVTVADHTFIVNKSRTVYKDIAEVPEVQPYLGFAWVKKGVASSDYTVTLNSTDKTFQTSDTTTPLTYRTNNIAAELKTLIDAFGTFAAVQKGSVLRIDDNSGIDDFTMTCKDSYGEQALVGIKNQVQTWKDLPPRCWDGVRVKITGNVEENADDYYLKYESTSDEETGVWRETRGWSIPGATGLDPQLFNKFDQTTMPHKLYRDSSGDWYLKPIDWNERLVGDENTAPLPSFVDRTITDVFFFRNRLGFLTDENVVLSAAGDYFRFFPKTIQETLDDDPIDIAVSHVKISILRQAVPFSETLLLFSNQTQFILSADGLLTPGTVKIDQTTEFESDLDVKPVGAGPNVYFAVQKGNFTGLKEYFVSEESLTNDAADITAHVPKYIPKNPFLLAASSNEDILLVVSEDEKKSIYVYKMYWQGDQKLQSCWSKWTFADSGSSGGTEIIGLHVIETKVYIVFKRWDGLYIESIDLQSGLKDTGLDFQVLLDRRVELTGSYAAGPDETTFTLPYQETTSTEMTVVLSSGFANKGSNRPIKSRPSTTQVVVSGDYSAHLCYVGRAYAQRYRFSEQFPRAPLDGQGPQSEANTITGGRLQLLRMKVEYTNSGYFYSEITPDNRTKQTNKHKGPVGGIILGQEVIESGYFTFPIRSKSNQVIIDLVNDSFTPSTFHSVEWTGEFVHTARRIS